MTTTTDLTTEERILEILDCDPLQLTYVVTCMDDEGVSKQETKRALLQLLAARQIDLYDTGELSLPIPDEAKLELGLNKEPTFPGLEELAKEYLEAASEGRERGQQEAENAIVERVLETLYGKKVWEVFRLA